MRWMVKSAGILTVVLACALTSAENNDSQRTQEITPEARQHIHELIQDLPNDSWIRQRLVMGGHGKGLRQPWMDDMRREGIKQTTIWIAIDFNRHGRPKHMKFQRAEYFAQYDYKQRVSDVARLGSIRSSGLEQKLVDLALERSTRGMWVDVPHPRPHPFIGATRLEFYDDEWIPAFEYPMYCAGESCLESLDNLNIKLGTSDSSM